MTQAFQNRLQSVDGAILKPLVGRTLQTKVLDIIDWACQPLTGGFSQENGEIYGIYRFQGTAQTQAGMSPWSLILKATGAASTGSQDPAAFDYWKREVQVYHSGLLEDLSGDLVAPRCLEIATYPDEEYWLWLDDIEDLADEVWPFEHYGQVARHLGHLNGAYVAPNPMPDVLWLSSGDFQQQLAMAKPSIAQLPELSQHPFFKHLLPGNSTERMLDLWEARDRLLYVRRQLPLTFCHHDALRRNLLTQCDSSGRQKTVLIDWARAGTGVVGEELVSLFAISLRFIAVDCDRIADLEATIFTNYVDGLRDFGWQGDPQLARFGFTATASLKYGVAAPAIKLPNMARRLANQPPNTEPPTLLGPGLEQHVVLQHHLLQMGEEALELSTQLV